MSEIKIKRALIAVYDKTGIVEFARALVQEFGIEIISTGGTARHLKEAGIPVTMVEEVTGFPEMLDGRVKTLHPKIHAGILADRDNPDHMRQLAEQGIKPIDMVVVNLYPFEETIKKPDCTFDEAIEMIDIGGPCMLRAAAKNHQSVGVVSSGAQFDIVLERMKSLHGRLDDDTLLDLAVEAFDGTEYYDERVHSYFVKTAARRSNDAPLRLGQSRLRLPIRRLHDALRYGENPHQSGAAYITDVTAPHEGISVVRQKPLGDTQMSFNNYLDAEAALSLCAELTRELRGLATAVCLKHSNACGVGLAKTPIEAYRQAYLGDPLAAMGGILAQNSRVDVDLAGAVMESLVRWGKDAGAGAFFVEVWIAPQFDDDAIHAIRTQKKWGERVRLLAIGDLTTPVDRIELDVRKIAGGMLLQDRDLVGLNEDQWKVVTDRTPTDAEMADLRLAWLVCKHTKSNAITVCKDGMLIGNGAGQMSRIMSCRIATWLAKENGHGEKLKGAVAASDAFFPFRDGPDILADAGVKAIIQPGGSKRDQDTIDACNERGLSMVFTGTRHFKH